MFDFVYDFSNGPCNSPVEHIIFNCVQSVWCHGTNEQRHTPCFNSNRQSIPPHKWGGTYRGITRLPYLYTDRHGAVPVQSCQRAGHDDQYECRWVGGGTYQCVCSTQLDEGDGCGEVHAECVTPSSGYCRKHNGNGRRFHASNCECILNISMLVPIYFVLLLHHLGIMIPFWWIYEVRCWTKGAFGCFNQCWSEI